jgi:hypothetical protein
MSLCSSVLVLDISSYVLRRSGLVEKYKGSPYVHWSIDIYKLCISVFKLRNIF